MPPLTNIAYTNVTCDEVNEFVALKHGLAFGKEGLYIAKGRHKVHGWMKNEFFDRRGKYMHSRNTDLIVFVDDAMVKRFFRWGYCTTIHKRIGETFDETFAIWDWRHPLMDRHIRYTALTRGKDLKDIVFTTRPCDPFCLCVQPHVDPTAVEMRVCQVCRGTVRV